GRLGEPQRSIGTGDDVLRISVVRRVRNIEPRARPARRDVDQTAKETWSGDPDIAVRTGGDPGPVAGVAAELVRDAVRRDAPDPVDVREQVGKPQIAVRTGGDRVWREVRGGCREFSDRWCTGRALRDDRGLRWLGSRDARACRRSRKRKCQHDRRDRDEFPTGSPTPQAAPLTTARSRAVN